MKNLTIAILALLAFAFTATAQQENPTDPRAPQYKYASVSLTGIGTTAGGATTTVTNGFIDVRGMKSVTLLTKFNFANTTTSNVVYTISKSVDKSNWETTGTTWTVAGNSTTPVIATTTIDTGSAGWLKLDSIQNTHASIVLTNTAFLYGVKRNSP